MAGAKRSGQRRQVAGRGASGGAAPGASAWGRAQLEVQDHRLIGSRVSQRETPNKSGLITPRYLVFHYTAGRSAQASIDWLCNPDAKASAHLVVARDGSITQLAPFNVKTWHAGRSHWDGLNGLNSYSIGIEMDNAGPLNKVGNTFRAWFGKSYPESEVLQAKHKLEQELRWWHTYTESQIEAAFELARLLVKCYTLKEVIGHEDIAPERKRDPGPAFPLDHIRAAMEGRAEEEEERYEVTADALNIRRGPGVEFEMVTSALPKGTRLRLLEKRDRWTRVDVEDQSDTEGWVYNRFIAKV